ncbi:hypothetical protein SSX86_024700 [Deinandra increscens subsp. villosa]|uniref:Integrase catalytic domain-containing protein n=1 Tax=Deinandra increscens subsp. villosa TaxID=3103831 RepID=A0AAP0GLC5_9ASTR
MKPEDGEPLSLYLVVSGSSVSAVLKVPREDNSEAYALANLALSLRIPENIRILITHVLTPAIAEQEAHAVENNDVEDPKDIQESWMHPIKKYLQDGEIPKGENPRAFCAKAPGGKVFMLAMKDYFSKWIEAEAYVQVRDKEVISFIKRNIITGFGIPTEITCDNGSHFIGKRTTNFCVSWGIKMINSTPVHPQDNGQAESNNKIIINNLKKKLGSKKGKWDEELPFILWADRTTAMNATGQTPFSLVFGTEDVIPTEMKLRSASEFILLVVDSIRIPLVRTSSELAVRRPGKAPEEAVPSPSPGRHAVTRSRRGSSSSSPPTADGFRTGTPVPSPQSQSFSRGYGSILPTSLAYIVPSTRGCSPWRPDAVMSTTGHGRHSVLRIFKGRRGRTGHRATCGALPAAGPYLRLSRFQGGQAVSAQFGTVTRLPVHPASPVLLTKNGPLGALDSVARLNKAAAPSYLFKTVRLVFRPYTQVRRTICTSVSLRASTRVSSGFAPLRHSSPSFGSRQACSHSNPSQKIKVDSLVRVSRRAEWGARRPVPGARSLGFGRHTNPHRSTPRVDRRTDFHRSTSDRDASPAPIRFPPDNFKHSLTLFSKSFSSFPRGTCLLSVSHQYLALDGIYRPIGAAFPNNPTRRQRLVVRQGPGTTGLSPSPAPPSRGLGPGPPLRTLLQTTIRTTRPSDFQAGLFPVRSPLLRESLRALNQKASGATCVQKLDGSRDSAIHTKYRILLRSSSMREPRYPLPRVVYD